MKKKKDVIHICLNGEGKMEFNLPESDLDIKSQILTLIGSLEYCKAMLIAMLHLPDLGENETK